MGLCDQFEENIDQSPKKYMYIFPPYKVPMLTNFETLIWFSMLITEEEREISL